MSSCSCSSFNLVRSQRGFRRGEFLSFGRRSCGRFCQGSCSFRGAGGLFGGFAGAGGFRRRNKRDALQFFLPVPGKGEQAGLFPVAERAQNIRFRAVKGVRNIRQTKSTLRFGQKTQKVQIYLYKFSVGSGHVGVDKNMGQESKTFRFLTL